MSASPRDREAVPEGAVIRLGLIGDNIAVSQAPRLHRLAGAQNGRDVTYDRLVPRELGKDHAAILADCAAGGYRGLNITYPYKEKVAALVSIPDPMVRRLGAVNTVLFEASGPEGHNTDHTGFISAYREARGTASPGVVLLIGTGGVGRAIAFALVALGATEIRLADHDVAKAEALSEDLERARPGLRIRVGVDAGTLAAGADGIINATPVGMTGHAGLPLPRETISGAWAFDAVYTPVETEFLAAAQAAGLQVIPGYELFIWQGVDAWKLFTGLPLDVDRLRTDLAHPETGAETATS